MRALFLIALLPFLVGCESFKKLTSADADPAPARPNYVEGYVTGRQDCVSVVEIDFQGPLTVTINGGAPINESSYSIIGNHLCFRREVTYLADGTPVIGDWVTHAGDHYRIEEGGN